MQNKIATRTSVGPASLPVQPREPTPPRPKKSASTASSAPTAVYQLIVHCESEDQQRELFERLNAEGRTCRLLVL